jgi:hypothetical protein
MPAEGESTVTVRIRSVLAVAACATLISACGAARAEHHGGAAAAVRANATMVRGGTAALYDEQPLEAAEMVMAFHAAYQSLGNEQDRHSMERCYQWYLGKNSRGLPMIDPNSWGCYDGIERNGLNLNQGSESILSYLIAHMAMIHG